jgi:hypothetical protein
VLSSIGKHVRTCAWGVKDPADAPDTLWALTVRHIHVFMSGISGGTSGEE